MTHQLRNRATPHPLPLRAEQMEQRMVVLKPYIFYWDCSSIENAVPRDRQRVCIVLHAMAGAVKIYGQQPEF